MKLKCITFDRNVIGFIFGAFHLYTDEGGFVREAGGRRLLALDGEPVLSKDFAGLIKTDNGNRAVRAGLPGTIDLMDQLEHPTK